MVRVGKMGDLTVTMLPGNRAWSPGVGIDSALVRHIVSLSSDPAPEQYPAPDPGETVEVLKRRDAERDFQRALCRRTWWRLTGEERAAFRTAVLSKESWFSLRTFGSLADDLCIREIGHILECAWHDA